MNHFNKRLNPILATFSLFGLLVPYNLIAETNFSYAKNLYIKSFPSNQAKNELSEKNDKNNTYKIKELSDLEMREIAFSYI
ncbi:MAG: hypothetical protein AB7R69_02800 [Candidatus Babeliales bacterium]